MFASQGHVGVHGFSADLCGLLIPRVESRRGVDMLGPWLGLVEVVQPWLDVSGMYAPVCPTPTSQTPSTTQRPKTRNREKYRRKLRLHLFRRCIRRLSCPCPFLCLFHSARPCAPCCRNCGTCTQQKPGSSCHDKSLSCTLTFLAFSFSLPFGLAPGVPHGLNLFSVPLIHFAARIRQLVDLHRF